MPRAPPIRLARSLRYQFSGGPRPLGYTWGVNVRLELASDSGFRVCVRCAPERGRQHVCGIVGILQSPRSPRRARELARLGPRCRSPIDPRRHASVIAITLITHITGLSHYLLLAFSLSTILSRHHCVSYSRIVIIVTIARALTITMLYSYVTHTLFTYTCAYTYA